MDLVYLRAGVLRPVTVIIRNDVGENALPQLRENEHRDTLLRNPSSDSGPTRGGFQNFLNQR
jgi:hypothetical protein